MEAACDAILVAVNVIFQFIVAEAFVLLFVCEMNVNLSVSCKHCVSWDVWNE